MSATETESQSQSKILCPKCGADVMQVIRKHVSISGKKKTKRKLLDPFFNMERHTPHCLYAIPRPTMSPYIEPLLFTFLSKIPKTRIKRVIGAVGQAR